MPEGFSRILFSQQARLKKQQLRNPSQGETEFGVCQPAVAEVSDEPARKFHLTHCQEKHVSH